jgi:molybdopterin molybdotransferase
MITVLEADRLLRANVRPFGSERVGLSEAAGRVLSESIFADRAYPPFNRVAMDGIAVAYSALEVGTRVFLIASTQRAGEAPHTLHDTASCIEVMTGAALPDACDTIIRYEDLRIEAGTATLLGEASVRAGQNVHTAGSDCSAGDLVLDQGVTLGPTHVAALASVGASELLVSASPRLAILATGDELVPVDSDVLPHQIRQSNGHAVHAALTAHGCANVHLDHSPDDEATMRRLLQGMLDKSDVVIISGGISAGRFDLVPALLTELGVGEVFHKVRQKPGKPFWFGTSEAGPVVFGLPGNPVSAVVCLCRYVLPYLSMCAGADTRFRRIAALTSLPKRKNDFTHFVPVERQGNLAHPVPSNGSGDFLSLLPSDGFVEVAPDVSAMEFVPYYSWS